MEVLINLIHCTAHVSQYRLIDASSKFDWHEKRSKHSKMIGLW